MEEEIFTILQAKILGQAQEGIWAQAVNLGSLQAVLVVKGEKAGETGRELLNFLAEGSQSLVKKNLAELSGLIEKIKERFLAENELFLVVALPVGKVLYLVSLGGAVFLKREENLVQILEGEGSASGFWQEGDLLFLANQPFFQKMTPAVLRENLNHLSPAEIAEKLAPQISSDEENAACAALILKFQKEEKETNSEEKMEKKAFAESFFLGRLKAIKLSHPQEGGKRTLLTVAIILIILLTGSIFFSLKKTRQSTQGQKFETLYQEVNSKFEEGKGLVGLNDPLARNRLTEAKDQLAQIRKIIFSASPDQEKRIRQLEEGVESNLVTLSRVYQLESLPLFWETGLLKRESRGEALAIWGSQIAILDSSNKLVYFLAAKTKSVQTLSVDELKESPQLLGLHGENIYLFNKEGIARLNARTKKIQEVVEKDEEWGEMMVLVSYGGNLYLLDRGKDKGQIWKYIATETGFSSRRQYLASEIQPDFSQAQDMAIDGSVWVLLTGQILKFSGGRPENFVISGLEGDFGQPQAIFTNEKSQNLYLLDSPNKKILVLSKEGNYQAQYLAEEIGQAQDLVVLEEEKKIFLLAGSKIYFIEMK